MHLSNHSYAADFGAVACCCLQVKVIAAADLSKVAAGEAMMMVREYSAAVQVPDHSVYVYVCKKPY
jgi:hypothetical protein